ncbi:hypothetical protein Hanom_Chr01g00063111 [Helianthus anomalus]
MLFKVRRMFTCYINALKKSNGDGRFGLSKKAYGIHGGSSPQHRFKILGSLYKLSNYHESFC